MEQMGKVFFDSDAKELVMVTNGKYKLNHSSPEAFQASHANGPCQYEPSEAMAIRVFIAENGELVYIAFTYRKVRAEALSPAPDAKSLFDGFRALSGRGRKVKVINVGRV